MISAFYIVYRYKICIIASDCWFDHTVKFKTEDEFKKFLLLEPSALSAELSKLAQREVIQARLKKIYTE